MRVALVTNWTPNKGLALDGRLLAAFLAELGHETVNVQFDEPCDQKFDLNIMLETVNEQFFQLASRSVWIPNLEWADSSHARHARRFDRIWAKTSDAEHVLREKYPHVTYTGFLSRDRMDKSVERTPRFLHVGGDSGLKNTNAVVSAWRQWRYYGNLDVALPELTVISRAVQTDVPSTSGIRWIKEVEDAELAQLQNSHLFHLQPSAYEGWGHAIRESQSVGAVLLTTGDGPMAELHAPFEVKPTGDRPVHMATAYNVSGREIRDRVGVMLEQPSHMIARYQLDARAAWQKMEDESRARLTDALESVTQPVRSYSGLVSTGPKPVIAMIGNFGAEHSTENDLAWTLENMGYKTILFQENERLTQDILDACEYNEAALLIYVHTHGWNTPGVFDLDTLWKKLKECGTKTCSFHLDRFWGIHGDRREELIGQHPFWRTDRVFTADGGNQDRFNSRGIRHTWLPPGVVKRDCVPGYPRRDLEIDVGFVGASGYHSEYPFRAELLEFMRSTYGDRFQIFQGYRGQILNDLYASVRVVVGDSCFGGSDYYWSDRVPETTGRGGLLIHPHCRGLDIPGLVGFSPGNLHELKDKIDWWLDHPTDRDFARVIAQSWVRENETYSNRMTTLLKVMNVN